MCYKQALAGSVSSTMRVPMVHSIDTVFKGTLNIESHVRVAPSLLSPLDRLKGARMHRSRGQDRQIDEKSASIPV